MIELRPYQAEALIALKRRLKETDTPLLVNASVGAGKSLIIAELLLVIERAGWRALCLTMNSTLISQNAMTYKGQGGTPGIYCAALGEKNTEKPVLFASPQSVINSIENNTGLRHVPFNLIVVDEAHNININNHKATYTKILNWYALQATKQHKFRIVGLTGTPYRGKDISIVKSPTNEAGWMEEVCSIDTAWLVKERYLVPPKWGKPKEGFFDFDAVKTNSMGKFNPREIKEAVCAKPRLTHDIMHEVQAIVASRGGAFIFATSVQHCYECLASLPCNETAVITGGTPDDLRQKYIASARCGEIKYLVNVNVLCTGVDVPNFDTVVFVRPTESLVLYMQAIGRGLRLSQAKKDCLVLDYAGNLERHGDIDHPIINQAIKQQSNDDPAYCIPCYHCQTMNKVTARRCIGISDNKRCEHYFDFKECAKCRCLNDITARYCRECKHEIIDPNNKLSQEYANLEKITLEIESCYYGAKMNTSQTKVVFYAHYRFVDNNLPRNKRVIVEEYATWTKKGRDYFYHNFVKEQFIEPGKAYKFLDNYWYLEKSARTGMIRSPHKVIVVREDEEKYKIVKKMFLETI